MVATLNWATLHASMPPHRLRGKERKGIPMDFTRRQVLKLGTVGGMGLFLAACGGSSDGGDAAAPEAEATGDVKELTFEPGTGEIPEPKHKESLIEEERSFALPQAASASPTAEGGLSADGE